MGKGREPRVRALGPTSRDHRRRETAPCRGRGYCDADPGMKFVVADGEHVSHRAWSNGDFLAVPAGCWKSWRTPIKGRYRVHPRRRRPARSRSAPGVVAISHGMPRLADIALTTIAGACHAAASARIAADTTPTKSRLDSHMARNQARSRVAVGSPASPGTPAADRVPGWLSPGWHQPMRSETVVRCPAVAWPAQRRSPHQLCCRIGIRHRRHPADRGPGSGAGRKRRRQGAGRDLRLLILVAAHDVVRRRENEAPGAFLGRGRGHADEVQRHVEGRRRVVPGCLRIGVLGREVHDGIGASDGVAQDRGRLCEIGRDSRDPPIFRTRVGLEAAVDRK